MCSSERAAGRASLGFEKSKIGGTGESETQRNVREFHSLDFAKEARSVLDRAIQDGVRIEREAYQAGFQQGEQAGIRLGREQMAPIIDQFHTLVENLTHARRDMLLEMEKRIVALAIAIAEKIVAREVEEDSAIVQDAVRAAIDASVDRGRLTIHVSPADMTVIENMRPELTRMESVEEVVVVADHRVDAGGCFIETTSGDIDATLGRAFREIRELLD